MCVCVLFGVPLDHFKCNSSDARDKRKFNVGPNESHWWAQVNLGHMQSQWQLTIRLQQCTINDDYGHWLLSSRRYALSVGFESWNLSLSLSLHIWNALHLSWRAFSKHLDNNTAIEQEKKNKNKKKPMNEREYNHYITWWTNERCVYGSLISKAMCSIKTKITNKRKIWEN